MSRIEPRSRVLRWLLLALALLLALPMAVHAQGGTYSESVRVHASQNPETPAVEGATATLDSSGEGIAYTFDTTGLEPGHAYTLWVAVVNDPASCESDPCAPPDLLQQTERTRSDVTWGAGAVAGDGGEVTLEGTLPAGGWDNSWYRTGLSNPTGAEVHLVLNDHGPVIDGMREEMLSTYRAGCTDESLPPSFPDSAKADGTPGPNVCRLVQFAIFQQPAATSPATLPETGGARGGSAAPILALLLGGTLLAAGWVIRRTLRPA